MTAVYDFPTFRNIIRATYLPDILTSTDSYQTLSVMWSYVDNIFNDGAYCFRLISFILETSRIEKNEIGMRVYLT